MAALSNRDWDMLISFVRYAYEFVHRHIEQGGDLSRDIEIDEDMRVLLRDAWAEYEERFSFGSIEANLHDIDPEDFAAAGLTGAQLLVKHQDFVKKRDRFEKHGGEKPFGKLVESIDDILKSFPSSALWREPLAELKDVMARNINSPWFRFLTMDISSKPLRGIKRFGRFLKGLMSRRDHA